MREQVLTAFQDHFGKKPNFIVRAPGRVNLIGEHTDYNDGFVMPFAVDRAIWMAVGIRNDTHFSVYTLDYGKAEVSYDISQLKDENLPHWTAYVRGAWWLMQEKGHTLPGVDVVIGSDIPPEGGMSSSAAIGVACIEMALAVLNDSSHSQSEKALLAVEIEHNFIGLKVGVMDQMSSAAPTAAHAVLLDCRTLEMEPVSIPTDAQVLVINSNKQRQLVGSEYSTRRQQCEAAAEILGVAALRDADIKMVEAHQAQLGDIRFRRARHVVLENARTLKMKTVLEAGDVFEAGKLLNEGHFSLRDDYESSIEELDILTEIARQHDDCLGARIMGGGFGGCAVSLMKTGCNLDTFYEYVGAAYTSKTGLNPEFYLVQATPGSHVEKL